MKLDFQSLSSEPLIYMLMHSGAFVTVLGVIFFIVGLLFGYATWGRYKRQARELRGEAHAMKDEIAGLKRKVADQSVKSGPAIAMATETIHMPKRDGTTTEPVPAVTEEPITSGDSRPPTTQTMRPPTKNRLQRPRANVIKPKPPAKATPAPEVAVTAAVKPPETSPAAEPATAEITRAPDETPPPPARHTSPLAAIIAPAAVKKEDDSTDDTAASNGAVPPDSIPTLPEIPATPPVVISSKEPELDPKLGLIYKSKPEHCDDLTALKGIAGVLEQKLHDLGIYTWQQIALWNDDQIKEFSSRLSFKDRIQREHWVEKARQLQAKQPGTKVE